MINFNDVIKENTKEHNLNWPQIFDHSYRILIIGGSVSGKTIFLFNLISHQPYIDEIYFYAKDPYKAGQLLINKRENTGLKHFNDSKAFIQCSNDMHDIYENIEKTIQIKKAKQ